MITSAAFPGLSRWSFAGSRLGRLVMASSSLRLAVRRAVATGRKASGTLTTVGTELPPPVQEKPGADPPTAYETAPDWVSSVGYQPSDG
nr:hypothetical protein GCM10020063_045070 [Dactylosporangium thailandense]